MAAKMFPYRRLVYIIRVNVIFDLLDFRVAMLIIILLLIKECGTIFLFISINVELKTKCICYSLLL